MEAAQIPEARKADALEALYLCLQMIDSVSGLKGLLLGQLKYARVQDDDLQCGRSPRLEIFFPISTDEDSRTWYTWTPLTNVNIAKDLRCILTQHPELTDPVFKKVLKQKLVGAMAPIK